MATQNSKLRYIMCAIATTSGLASLSMALLYSLIIYEIVNFSFFALYSLLLLSFFLYLKSVPIYVIVHVPIRIHMHGAFGLRFVSRSMK